MGHYSTAATEPRCIFFDSIWLWDKNDLVVSVFDLPSHESWALVHIQTFDRFVEQMMGIFLMAARDANSAQIAFNS